MAIAVPLGAERKMKTKANVVLTTIAMIIYTIMKPKMKTKANVVPKTIAMIVHMKAKKKMKVKMPAVPMTIVTAKYMREKRKIKPKVRVVLMSIAMIGHMMKVKAHAALMLAVMIIHTRIHTFTIMRKMKAFIPNQFLLLSLEKGRLMFTMLKVK